MSLPGAQRLDLARLLLRVVVGLAFLASGLEKVLRGPDWVASSAAQTGFPWPDLTGPLVACLELIGGAALIGGILTGAFGLLFVIEMAAAIVIVRWPEARAADSLVDAFSTLRLELLLGASAAAVVLLGPGRWSLDALVRGRRGVSR